MVYLLLDWIYESAAFIGLNINCYTLLFFSSSRVYLEVSKFSCYSRTRSKVKVS